LRGHYIHSLRESSKSEHDGEPVASIDRQTTQDMSPAGANGRARKGWATKPASLLLASPLALADSGLLRRNGVV
jgi:hypothetical protein